MKLVLLHQKQAKNCTAISNFKNFPDRNPKVPQKRDHFTVGEARGERRKDKEGRECNGSMVPRNFPSPDCGCTYVCTT